MNFLETINITPDEIEKDCFDFDYYASGDYVCHSLWINDECIITNDNIHFPIEDYIEGFIDGYEKATRLEINLETAILITSKPYKPWEDDNRYFLKKEGK